MREQRAYRGDSIKIKTTIEDFDPLDSYASYISGLFGSISAKGKVQNLTLVNPRIQCLNSSDYYYGGLLVGGLHGRVTNCHVIGGHIEKYFPPWPRNRTYGRIGGLVGSMDQDAVVSDCSVTDTSIRGDGSGGVLGGDGRGTIQDCTVHNIDIIGGYYAGGIIARGSGTIERCSATGVIRADAFAGGIVGVVSGGSAGWPFDPVVRECYASCSVSSDNIAGGLVGRAANKCLIINCYAAGSVEGQTDTAGLVSCFMNFHGEAPQIVNCYAAASVTGSNRGGLISHTHLDGGPVIVVNSFWDVEASGVRYSAGGTGRTTAQMKTKDTFTTVGWNFTTPIWKMCDRPDYPRLWWEECLPLRIIYVDADATGANNGSNWADAFNNLQAALVVAESSDEILVAQGIYKPGNYIPPPPPLPPLPPPSLPVIDRTATFQLKNGVVIKGGYAGFGEPDPNARDIKGYETIFSGDLAGNDEPNFVNYEENSYHVLTGSQTDETAVLDGFTITAGYANGFGNPDDSGGGMYNTNGSPTVINCTFSKNAAVYAGGMANRDYCSTTLINCTFIGNSVHSSGAGMFDWNSDSKLINCNFSGNFGRYGAAMQIDNSISKLTNCTFSGNFARQEGGALYVSFSAVDLSNCSFTSNVAGLFYGGGIYNRDGYSILFLNNCILFNNSDSGGMDESAQIHGGTPFVNYCCIQGWTGTWIGSANTGSDPMFERNPDDGGDGWGVGDRVNFGALLSIGSNDDFGDLHLQAESPCINAGDPDYIAEPNETDLDGNPRVIGGRIDMGAYEFFNAVPVADAGPDQVVECACNTAEGTKVTLDGSGSYDEDGDAITFTWTGPFVGSPMHGTTPTVTLEAGCQGDYIITLVVNDGTEDSEPDNVVITVVDTTPPQFEFSVTPTLLWPPDHKMVLITPSWMVSDDCDASPDVSLVGIVANEGDNTVGDGHTSNDIQIGEDGSIYLRSERSGTSDERVYTITYQAVDDCGNATLRSATVSIPHDFKVLARIASRWLWAGPADRIPEDLNGDGVVNLKDIAIFANNWIQ